MINYCIFDQTYYRLEMSANFSVQFRINEKTQTRVIRLTDASSGFTLAKGNFSVTFPDGSTRIKTEWTSPDITSPAAYIDILAVTDTNNNAITGSYKIDFIALDAATTSYSASKTFNFNWVKPSNGITDLSDVLIPQVQFKDNTSYSPIGSFTGTPTRVFSTPFPTTSEASAQPATTTSTNTLTPVYTGNYYEGVYNVSNDITCNYTHTSNSWLTINYIELFTKTVSIKKCPTQIELIGKINTYRGIVEAYKEKNDTQFNLLSEQYDLAIALYSHIIARYETGTQDGSEGQLRELLSILEPYTGSYTYQSTKMLQFELASSGANSFNITDGTNTDSVALGSSLLFSSGNAALVPSISNNQVSYTPIFGSSANTFVQGNDSRLHNAVTIGTANGLSLASQVLSLALATNSASGAFSASDKAKLDGIAAGANTGTVTSVAISVPSAFSVSGSPITTNGTINISATGNPLQYITGAGALATLNTAAVPENGSLYFTNSRARASISVTGSLSYNSTTGVISYTTPSETDPVFTASAAYGISSTNISNWNTAYGWGNHASAGYLTSINSSQVTTALGYTPENSANKGIANGYASLDGAGLVPSTQLPSYVDDVLEYANLASFPLTGTTGKIYVDLTTNKIYRWSGTIYVEISSSAGGGGTWGSIIGTLSNQTDLQAALDAKQNSLGFTPVTDARTLTINGVAYDLTANRTWTISGLLPVGGTAGQILSKVDGTNYNTTWIDNFASQLKHDVKLGATLAKGKAVYVSSGNGTNMIVSAASNASEATSSKTLGLLETGGVANDTVKVITEGLLAGLDTSTATAGDPVWLGTNGDLIFGLANKPVAPAHLVFIGIVTRVQSNNGEIFVKPQNGFEIEELYNVLFTSKTNKDLMYYDSATSLWKNAQLSAVLGYTPYDAANPSNYIALTALSSSATGLTYTNTTGVFSLTSGYAIPTTASATNWDTAYTNRITSLTTTGSSGAATLSANTLNIPTYTLAGLGGQASSTNLTSLSSLSYVSASFVKMTAAGTFALDTNTYYLNSNPSGYTSNTGTVTSVAGTGTVSGLTLTGSVTTSGSLTLGGTLSLTSGNVTTALGYTPVTNTRTITINGTAYDLSADRSWTISAGTTLNGTGFVKASGTTITYDNSTYVPTTGTGATGTWGISITGTSSNITAYSINQNLSTSSTPTFADIYANGGWFRNNSAGTGLYNQATVNHFYSTTSNDWNIAATGGYPKLWLRDGYGGTSKLALYSDSAASGLLNSVSYWGFRMNYGSGYLGGADMFGPIGFRSGLDNNGEVAGGMKMISHSVKKVGSSKFIKINAGTNNYFTGFIFGMNFDDYPPNSVTNTGSGFSYQFGGWSDGSGAHGDKFFDMLHFGGNNVGLVGREMNTDGNGYIITSLTSTGAGGYKCSATIMLFARDMSKVTITYY